MMLVKIVDEFGIEFTVETDDPVECVKEFLEGIGESPLYEISILPVGEYRVN
jgi:hypothetical protein